MFHVILSASIFLLSSTAIAAPPVAVFDIADSGAKLKKSSRERLTRYLATRLAEGGRYAVVPQKQLRAAMAKQKKKSFRSCVDEACQIEIGKEVAAQKSLHTEISRLGKVCIVTSTLFDLRTAASERAASHRSACRVEALVEAIDKVATDLGGTAAAPKKTRGELSVNVPSKTTVYVGLTYVGDEPMRINLENGPYTISAETQDMRQDIAQIEMAGKPAEVKLNPVANRTRAPDCKAPDWVMEGTGLQKGQLQGVGVASGFVDPMIREGSSELNAIAELSLALEQSKAQLMKDYGVSEKQSNASKIQWLTVRDRFACGQDLYTRVAIDLQARTKTRYVEVTGRGGGDVHAYGATGPKVEHSAELAALADAAHRAIRSGRGLKASSLKKVFGDQIERYAKASVNEVLKKKNARLKVQLVQTSSFEASKERTEKTHERHLKVLFESPRGKGVVVIYGQVINQISGSPADVLKKLRATMEALGFVIQDAQKKPRLRGAPVTEVRVSIDMPVD